MTDVRRDATLAALSGALFLAVLRVTGSTATLLNPVAAVVGVGGGAAVEAAFVFGTPVSALWERPWARGASTAVLVAGVAVTVVVVGPVVAAAACWGLLTYFAVLGLALAGYWPHDLEAADG